MQNESPKQTRSEQRRSPEELPKAEELNQRLKHGVADLIARFPADAVHLVGIYSGGAWLAERLKTDLGIQTANALFNTSLYRDDFRKSGLHTQ